MVSLFSEREQSSTVKHPVVAYVTALHLLSLACHVLHTESLNKVPFPLPFVLNSSFPPAIASLHFRGSSSLPPPSSYSSLSSPSSLSQAIAASSSHDNVTRTALNDDVRIIVRSTSRMTSQSSHVMTSHKSSHVKMPEGSHVMRRNPANNITIRQESDVTASPPKNDVISRQKSDAVIGGHVTGIVTQQTNYVTISPDVADIWRRYSDDVMTLAHPIDGATKQSNSDVTGTLFHDMTPSRPKSVKKQRKGVVQSSEVTTSSSHENVTGRLEKDMTRIVRANRRRRPVGVYEEDNSNGRQGEGGGEGKEGSGVGGESFYYSSWSRWSNCSRSTCTQRRSRTCHRRGAEGSVAGSGSGERGGRRSPARADSGKGCRRALTVEQRTCFERTGDACSFLIFIEQTRSEPKQLLYKLLYGDWSAWSTCSERTCKRKRYRSCLMRRLCRNSALVEETPCTLPPSGEKGEQRCPSPQSIKKAGATARSTSGGSGGGKGGTKKGRSEEVQRALDAWRVTSETCGRRQVVTRGSLRIVGGQEARRGSWPWVVAIMTPRYEEQYCGGALIAPQWVLTAAHCVRKNGRRRRLIVRIGDHKLSNSEGTERTMSVEDDFAHEAFDLDTIDSDIALIKLRHPVTVDKYVNIACLPRPSDTPLPPGTLCYAIGWGKTRDDQMSGTDVLREAKVPLLDDAECRGSFDYHITRNQMCAGFSRGGVDTCAGDSGGPLMCQMPPVRTEFGGPSNSAPRWFVYGVTSFGEGCGDRGKYGIYTRVTNYYTWIRDIIVENS